MFKPILDRVLLRRIPDDPTPGVIVTPDAYTEKPLRGEIVALGNGVVLGDTFHRLDDFVQIGDIVRFSEYNVEDIEVDGEKFVLIRIQDIKGRYRGY